MGQQISNEFPPNNNGDSSSLHGLTTSTTSHGPYDDMMYSNSISITSEAVSNNNSMMTLDNSQPTLSSSSSNTNSAVLTSTTTSTIGNEQTDHQTKLSEKALKRKSANFTEAISMMHHQNQQHQQPSSSSISSLTIVSSNGSMYHHQRSTSQESPTSSQPLANSPPSTLSTQQHSQKHLSIDSRLFALLNNKNSSLASSDSNNRSSRTFQQRPFSISSLDSLGFDGINKVLKDKLLLSQFRNYTKMEYSEENLDIFLVSNQLLEECKKNLDNVIDGSSSSSSLVASSDNSSKRNSVRLQTKSKLYKIAQSQFAFEEKIIKKLEKSLEQVIEKMQKMNLEKRKSLMKGRRKNTEFLGIDRNMFKQAFASEKGGNTSESGGNSSFDEDLFANSLSGGSSASGFGGLEEINVGKKLKSQIEKIKENNQTQQQWLANKRSSKRMSMKFFSSSAILIQGSSVQSSTQQLSNSHPSNLEGNNSLSPTSSIEDQDGEEIPQIKIVQFLEDLRFECLMNLKDTFIRFCQQNKLSVR